jgi:hypothetical protein
MSDHKLTTLVNLSLGFALGIFFIVVLVSTVMLLIPVDPPLADSIHISAPAPHDD